MNTMTMDSPVGPITVEANDGFITSIQMGARHRAPDAPTPVLHEGITQLQAYFDGQLEQFDLPLAAEGTAFQRRVWDALRGIGFGRTASYGEIAARIGSPTASRAVGMANARNPIAIVVPCHRVIGASGTLTGYAGGLDRKRFLLEHEGAAFTS